MYNREERKRERTLFLVLSKTLKLCSSKAKSMVANLQLFHNDGIELIVNTETGESFASVSGYARMSGKDKSTISRRLESVAESFVNKVEIQTQ